MISKEHRSEDYNLHDHITCPACAKRLTTTNICNCVKSRQITRIHFNLVIGDKDKIIRAAVNKIFEAHGIK